MVTVVVDNNDQQTTIEFAPGAHSKHQTDTCEVFIGYDPQRRQMALKRPQLLAESHTYDRDCRVSLPPPYRVSVLTLPLAH